MVLEPRYSATSGPQEFTKHLPCSPGFTKGEARQRCSLSVGPAISLELGKVLPRAKWGQIIASSGECTHGKGRTVWQEAVKGRGESRSSTLKGGRLGCRAPPSSCCSPHRKEPKRGLTQAGSWCRCGQGVSAQPERQEVGWAPWLGKDRSQGRGSHS